MIRKVWQGLSVLVVLAPGVANALGVGNYDLHSYLNQPLSMDIPLTGTADLAPGDVIVGLADKKAFDHAGIKRTALLSALDFKVKLSKDGGSVHISTNKNVNVPYLDFLVQILWPTGRIVREYSLLLDPASYAKAQTPVSLVSPTSQPQAVTATPSPKGGSIDRQQARGAATTRSAPQQATPEAGSSTQSRARTYKVKKGDTLWSIATRERGNNHQVSVQQMVMAIQKANPNAFNVKGNANSVRSGAVLRIPSANVAADLNAREARQRLVQQNRRWQQQRAQQPEAGAEQISAGSHRVVRTDNLAGGAIKGQVKLLGGDHTKGAASASGNAAAHTKASSAAGNSSAKSAQMAERLDKLSQQNSEMSSRIVALNKQISTSNKLLKLSSSRLALMQAELKKLKQQGAKVDPSLLKKMQVDAGNKPATDESTTVKPTADKSATAQGGSAAPAKQKHGEQTSATVTASTQAAANTASAKAEPTTTTAKSVTQPSAQAAVKPIKPQQKPAVVSNNKADKPASAPPKSASKAEAKNHTAAEAKKHTAASRQAASDKGMLANIIDYLQRNLLTAGLVVVLLLLLVLAWVKRSRRDSAAVEAVNFEADDLSPEGQRDLVAEESTEADTPAETGLVADTSLGADDANIDTANDDRSEDDKASDTIMAAEGDNAEVNAEGAAADSVAENVSEQDDVALDSLFTDSGSPESFADNTDASLDAETLDGELPEFTAGPDAGIDDASTAKEDTHSLAFDASILADTPEETAGREGLADDDALNAVEFEGVSLDELNADTAPVPSDGSTQEEAADALEFSIDPADTTFSFDDWQADESTADNEALDLPLEAEGIDLATASADLDTTGANLEIAAAELEASSADSGAEEVKRLATEPSGDASTDATQPADSPAELQATFADTTEDAPEFDAAGLDVDARPSAIDPAALEWSDDGDFELWDDDGDGNATRLDLARAYLDMGDHEGARELLSEVVNDGDAQQQTEAKQLLEQMV